jgi:hypothetical protein
MSGYVFTFGANHTHPRTKVRLANRYVVIDGASAEAARLEMVRRFGESWCWQYPDADEAGVERFKLVPLEGDMALGKRRG